MGRPAPMHLSEDEWIHVQCLCDAAKPTPECSPGPEKSDEGWTDAEIAEVLDISEQTIRNIRQRLRAGGVEAVLTDKQQARADAKR